MGSSPGLIGLTGWMTTDTTHRERPAPWTLLYTRECLCLCVCMQVPRRFHSRIIYRVHKSGAWHGDSLDSIDMRMPPRRLVLVW